MVGVGLAMLGWFAVAVVASAMAGRFLRGRALPFEGSFDETVAPLVDLAEYGRELIAQADVDRRRSA